MSTTGSVPRGSRLARRPGSNLDAALSLDSRRASRYQSFLDSLDEAPVSLMQLVRFGSELMSASDLHDHHFEFSSDPIWATSRHLALHALRMPLSVDSDRQLSLPVSRAQALRVLRLFEKRIVERMPAAYITGQARYLGNTFYVNRHVLVPRSAMTFRLRRYLASTTWRNHRVLDLCAGSGCIGISLALMNPRIRVDLVDVSARALAVAKTNIQRFSLGRRVRCIRSDVFDAVNDKYDLIVTNPPYVSTTEYAALPREFMHEPKIALECGSDGLDVVHRILARAGRHLNPSGKLYAEVGATAVKHIRAAYPHVRFRWQAYMRPDGTVSKGGPRIFWLDRPGLRELASGEFRGSRP